jgi:hypothetical protein
MMDEVTVLQCENGMLNVNDETQKNGCVKVLSLNE